ncbi:unnamed protein product [marine sediment metagenome]|uniref:Uncharacterized protein n=1 Tax=marine sediment metagenome TaxID=412755 RepID=X1S3M3_9ZZZZ
MAAARAIHGIRIPSLFTEKASPPTGGSGGSGSGGNVVKGG